MPATDRRMTSNPFSPPGRVRRRAALLALLTTAGCTAAARERLAGIFFDTTAAERGSRITSRRPAALRSEGRTAASFVAVHPPFRERRCVACHSAGLHQLPARTGDACAACHAGLYTPRLVLHGPFAAGACMVCHTPHVSDQPALLKTSDSQLCLDCHEMTRFPACSGRRAGIVHACTPCHDPHATDLPYLLKPREGWEHMLTRGMRGPSAGAK